MTGWASLRQGRTDEAAERFAQAEADAAARGATEAELESRMGLGDVAAQRGDFAGAAARWAEVAAAADGALALRAEARENLASAITALQTGQLESARTALEAGLAKAERAQDTLLMVRLLANRAELALRDGELAGLPARLEAGLAHARRSRDEAGEGQLERSLGRLESARGELEAAARHFAASAEIGRRLGLRRLTAMSLQELAILERQRGRWLAALRGFEASLEADPSNLRLRAYALNAMASIHARQGDWELARARFEAAAEAFEILGDAQGQLMATLNLGALDLERGEAEAALARFTEGRALAERSGQPAELPGIELNRGRALHALGRRSDAIRALEGVLAERDGPPVRRALAAIELGALRLEQRNPPAALRLAEQALGGPGGEIGGWAATLRGRALRQLGRLAEARLALRAAVEAIELAAAELGPEEIATERFFAGGAAAFEEAGELELEAGAISEGLELWERGRARALLRRLGQPRRPTEIDAETVALRDRLAALQRAAPSAVGSKRAAHARAVTEARAALQARRLALFLAEAPPRPVPTSPPLDMAALTEGGTALLVLTALERSTWAVLIRPGPTGATPRLEAFRLGLAGAALKREVERFRRAIAERSADVDALGVRLHAALVEPWVGSLDGLDRLVLLPEGVLWQLPFQALGDAEGRALGQRFALRYAPSLTALQELRTQALQRAATRRGPRTWLGVGDPTWPSMELPPLPDARAEVLELERLYGASTGRTLLAEAATEAHVKAELPRHRLLHLATHARFDDRNPLDSSLLLAPGEAGEDGRLEGWEIAALTLEADLVVLAGCQTGRSGSPLGDGVLGLAWAFAAAGTPSVVASQGDVDSRAARTLMLAFHRALRAGAPKAEALRQAQATVAAHPATRHTFYWAPFLLLGDG